MDAKKQSAVIEQRAREGSPRAQYLLAVGCAGKLLNLHLEEIETLLKQEIGDGGDEAECRWEDVAAAWADDEENAFNWARKAAEGGITPALRLLGVLYRHGIGTQKDAEACFRWMECAALNGDIRAQVNLAQFHENGEGTPCDDAKAEEWYSRVANRSAGVLDWSAESKALLGLARLSRDGKRRAGDQTFQTEMYRKAAEMGDPEGQGRYARALVHGEGVDQDLAEAARWYRRSAEGGNATSQNNLAGMYADGEGVEIDEAEAVRWYKKAAAAGQREAEYNLAQRYVEGRGVEKDEARGVALLRRVADKGMLDAQFDLGQMLWRKPASGRDLMEAVTRLAIAAEQGHGGAKLALHDIAGVDVSPDEQIREFGFVRVHPTGKMIGGHPVYRDAKRGPQRRGPHGRQAHALAGLYLGNMYADGTGVTADKARAVACWYEAAMHGHPIAMVNVADAYEKGWGVERDIAEAIRLYQIAASHGESTAVGSLLDLNVALEPCTDLQVADHIRRFALEGNADKQFVMGIWHLNGVGVEQDEARARELLKGAAEAGQREAEYEVAVRYAEGVDAYALLERAGRQGLAKAQVELGRRLSEGKGCAIDEAAATTWFRKAAEQRYAPGLYEMARSYEEGIGVEENGLNALHLYEAAARQEHLQAMEKVKWLFERHGPDESGAEDGSDRAFLSANGRLPTMEEWGELNGYDEENPVETSEYLPMRFRDPA